MGEGLRRLKGMLYNILTSFFSERRVGSCCFLLIMNNIYILIAVFALLMVILVWAGAKYIHDIRRNKQRQEARRREWKRRMSETIARRDA